MAPLNSSATNCDCPGLVTLGGVFCHHAAYTRAGPTGSGHLWVKVTPPPKVPRSSVASPYTHHVLPNQQIQTTTTNHGYMGQRSKTQKMSRPTTIHCKGRPPPPATLRSPWNQAKKNPCVSRYGTKKKKFRVEKKI